MSKQKTRVKVFVYLGPRFYMLGPYLDSVPNPIEQHLLCACPLYHRSGLFINYKVVDENTDVINLTDNPGKMVVEYKEKNVKMQSIYMSME